MGDWHAGRITSRRLVALIEGLPEDNALARAKNEGRTWTLLHRMVWSGLGELYRQSHYWRGFLKIKPQNDRFKWPTTPWEESENSRSYGSVAAADQAAAIDYLSSLYK